MLTLTNNTILLVGGTSKLDGLQERLQLQLDQLMGDISLDVRTPSSGENSAWIGGSLLADQADFIDRCVDEAMYLEHGSNIVHRLFI